MSQMELNSSNRFSVFVHMSAMLFLFQFAVINTAPALAAKVAFDTITLKPKSEVSVDHLISDRCIVKFIIKFDAQGPNYTSVGELAYSLGFSKDSKNSSRKMMKRLTRNKGEVFKTLPDRPLKFLREDFVESTKQSACDL